MALGNAFGAVNRTRTAPVPVQRTTRSANHRILTSMPAGKMVPLAAIPLLREDSLARGSFRLGFEMSETVEVLMNAVNVRVMAYLVSNLALDRFDGIDSINKSYEGLPVVEGGPVIPWFEMVDTVDPATGCQILQYMGKHARSATGAVVNTHYIEAYNQIWNFRAKNRSKDIPLADRLNYDLLPAFWEHQTFAYIVPDFDQAVIDGEVALSVAEAKMPVKGLGFTPGSVGANGPNLAATQVNESGSTVASTYDASRSFHVSAWDSTATGGAAILAVQNQSATGAGMLFPDIYAELAQNGITMSLSNIDLARKTQAFARLRQTYSGHSDEYIIDLLMDGISLPDQAWKQPILLGDVRTVFGMSKRYAADGASLTESVVNGATYLDINFTCPKVNTGGVIMLVAEISPEQLFERQRDPFLHASSVDDLPQFLRDTLDPEKVSVVTNDEVDTDHTKPNDTFGYAPLNHQWAKSIPQIGGKFYRPKVDAPFDEDRQRIWAVETVDPVLSKDFYLCTTMHYKPFVVTDTAIDPFEVLVRGSTSIRGNTVFGGLLVEATDNYDKVMEQAPVDRIDKPAPAAAAAPAAPATPATPK